MPGRRLLAALVVAGAAMAMLALPAGGQTAPPATLTIDEVRTIHPNGCANPGDNFDLGVRGRSNQRSVGVVLYSPRGDALDKSSATPDTNQQWSTSVVWNSTQTGLYEIRATAGSAAPVSAWIEVPCQPPSLEYDPPCFAVGTTSQVTMTVRHFPPYGTGYMYYDVGGSEAQNRIRIPVDGHGVFRATFNVKPSNRSYPGEGTDANRTLVARATWSACPPGTVPTTTTSTTGPPPSTTLPPVIISVPTSTTTTSVVVPPITPGAALTISPKLGPPGFVAQAIGTGFPAGPVELVWTPGIGRTIATAGPDGAFTTQVLVFPKDRIGPRILVATGAGGASANAPFLVVPPTVQPSSGSEVAQITRIRRFTQR